MQYQWILATQSIHKNWKSFCVNVEPNLLCLCALHNLSTFLLQQKSWLCEKRSIQLIHTGENITTLILKEMWCRKKSIAFIWHTFIPWILFQIYFIIFLFSSFVPVNYGLSTQNIFAGWAYKCLAKQYENISKTFCVFIPFYSHIYSCGIVIIKIMRIHKITSEFISSSKVVNACK